MNTTYNCAVCGGPIAPNAVRVHFDITGGENTVDPRPSHMKCYLDGYDPGLFSNTDIVRHVRDRANDALDRGLGWQEVAER